MNKRDKMKCPRCKKEAKAISMVYLDCVNCSMENKERRIKW